MDDKTNVTIVDVAKASHVSVTTVSRYLNGKFESMSVDTRNRIRDVINSLGFMPNKSARSLKSQNTMTIGCIVADLASPFSSELIKGIDYVCKKKGYSLLIADSDNCSENEVLAIKNLIANQVSGLIINTTGGIDDFIIKVSKEIPLVLADRCLNQESAVDTVTTDNAESTYSCMQYLKSKGYEEVAFFTPDVSNISTRSARLAAFRKSIKELWGKDPETLIYYIDSNRKDSVEAALSAFIDASKNKSSAVFCVNGVVTLQILQAMKKSGIEIGKDLGICGFDDWGWAEIVGPGITTIVPGTYNIGVKSAELVMKRIAAKNSVKPKCVVLKNVFYRRGSTNETA